MTLAGFVFLVRRRKPGTARMAGEHHVDRDQQQQHATGDPERRQGNAEEPQHGLAEHGEEEEDPRGDERAAQRKLPPLGRRALSVSAA